MVPKWQRMGSVIGTVEIPEADMKIRLNMPELSAEVDGYRVDVPLNYQTGGVDYPSDLYTFGPSTSGGLADSELAFLNTSDVGIAGSWVRDSEPKANILVTMGTLQKVRELISSAIKDVAPGGSVPRSLAQPLAGMGLEELRTVSKNRHRLSEDHLLRLPNLTEDERATESAFIREVIDAPVQVIQNYRALAQSDQIFEVDLAKKAYSGWGEGKKPESIHQRWVRAVGNTSLHPTAQAVTALAFLDRLDELEKLPDGHPDKRVFVTMGPVAAGKGSLLALMEERGMEAHFGATWDAAGEGNAVDAQWVFEEARARGVPTVFGYASNDPEVQIRDLVVRAHLFGRMVDLLPYVTSYTEGKMNAQTLFRSPAFQEALKDGSTEVFGIQAGPFNVESLEDKNQSPYPQAQALKAGEDTPLEIPETLDASQLLTQVLHALVVLAEENSVSDDILEGAVAGVARRWPETAVAWLNNNLVEPSGTRRKKMRQAMG